MSSCREEDVARYSASSFWIKSQSLWNKLVQAAQVSKELPKKGGTGYVEGYPGGSRLTGIPGPKRVLPWSMVQPGLAMEQACELGTK
ncbi:hypothetical protein V6N13_131963 [Hibiscus sabdariffa]